MHLTCVLGGPSINCLRRPVNVLRAAVPTNLRPSCAYSQLDVQPIHSHSRNKSDSKRKAVESISRDLIGYAIIRDNNLNALRGIVSVPLQHTANAAKTGSKAHAPIGRTGEESGWKYSESRDGTRDERDSRESECLEINNKLCSCVFSSTLLMPF